jgi:hypothetical protein
MSSPAGKKRKFALKPIVVEKTTLQLLKPLALEILQQEPYVSSVFLNAFFAIAKRDEDEQILDEKALENHLIKGYKSVSYK